jgi:hypothetical protein
MHLYRLAPHTGWRTRAPGDRDEEVIDFVVWCAVGLFVTLNP